MVLGESSEDRERWWWVVLMMRAPTRFSEESQPWAPPAGHIFCSCFSPSDLQPLSGGIQRMYVELAACWGANFRIWMGGQRSAVCWWEGKWASPSWTQGLHLDKWSTSPFHCCGVMCFGIIPFPPPSASESNGEHQWQHIEWVWYFLSSDIYIVSLL